MKKLIPEWFLDSDDLDNVVDIWTMAGGVKAFTDLNYYSDYVLLCEDKPYYWMDKYGIPYVFVNIVTFLKMLGDAPLIPLSERKKPGDLIKQKPEITKRIEKREAEERKVMEEEDPLLEDLDEILNDL